MTTGKEILEKHAKTVVIANMKVYIQKDQSLAAMREVAEIAFYKGLERGIYVESGHEEQKPPMNKEEFLNSLFPETKENSGIVVSNGRIDPLD